jgi:hypothetical protein
VLAYQRRYKDFTWLVGYLLGPERETGLERVEWTTTRNLPTSDPELGARVMREMAGQNPSTKKPVYHIMLTAAPEDPIDRAMMERMADRVLDRLGLTEHQAVLVAHLDRPHHHLHIMVNRVHPETGRAWSTWQDWAPVMAVLREEERALGLQQVPSPAQRVREVSRDLAIYERLEALSREQQKAEAEANTARARATRLEQTAARARATRDRRDADLAQAYRDPPKAYSAYVAAVDREGLPAATERMRERPEEFGALRTVERSRALGLVHTADEGPARAAARAAATAAEEALEAAGAWRIEATVEAERAQQAFARELDTVYQDPTAARAAFERLAAERGVEQAAARLGTEPAALGAVRTSLNQEPMQFPAQLAQAVALGVESAQAHARAMAASATPGKGPLDPGPELTRSELDRAMARDGALRAELRALPSRTELERRLSVALDRLSPRALAVLKYRVTRLQFAIALQLRRTFRNLALGREEERDQ